MVPGLRHGVLGCRASIGYMRVTSCVLVYELRPRACPCTASCLDAQIRRPMPCMASVHVTLSIHLPCTCAVHQPITPRNPAIPGRIPAHKSSYFFFFESFASCDLHGTGEFQVHSAFVRLGRQTVDMFPRQARRSCSEAVPGLISKTMSTLLLAQQGVGLNPDFNFSMLAGHSARKRSRIRCPPALD